MQDIFLELQLLLKPMYHAGRGWTLQLMTALVITLAVITGDNYGLVHNGCFVDYDDPY